MKKQIIIFCILFSAVLAAHSQTEIENIRNTEITRQELYEHIKYLASYTLEGRAPGTEGDRLAQEYLGRELGLYNISPAGDDSTFIQHFSTKSQGYVSSYVTDIEFYVNDNPFYFEQEDVALLNESHNGLAEGNLMFAGYGINSEGKTYSDFIDTAGNEIDAEGKIVFILNGVPGYGNINKDDYDIYNSFVYKIAALRRKKVSGIILIQEKLPPGFTDDRISLYEPPAFYFTAGVPVILMKRKIAAYILKKCGYELDSLQEKIDRTLTPVTFELPGSLSRFSDKARRSYLKTGNVIGIIEGADPVYKKEYIVIGAHYDHEGKQSDAYGNIKDIYFGADDNASGTAGIMEIVQKLSANRHLLKRSVIVIFFGAEEGGLLGSRFFIESLNKRNFNISAMINLDMIGRMRKNKLEVFGTGTMPYWLTVIKDINKKYGFDIKCTASDHGRSDQKSFIDYGIPAVHFYTGTHKDYHTPGDIPEKINSNDACAVSNLVYELITDLCTNESLQIYDSSLPDEIDVTNEIIISEMYGSNTGKVYLGCTFDLFKSVKGLYVETAAVDSPAEICGLKHGDRIIKIGDDRINDISDYADIIKKYSPYQKTWFTIIRGKREIKIMVLFGYAE